MESNSNTSANHLRATRYITGEMTILEKFWFERIIAINPAMKSTINTMKKDWDSIGESLTMKDFNSNKAWSNLYQRFEQEQLLPEKNSISFKFVPQQYLKYAAIILFAVILSGVGGYKYFNPELKQLANNSNSNTIIATLPDGTSIYLAQNSTLTYPSRFVGGKRKVKLDGEAYFEVAKNPKKSFIIETKAASVQVLGTSFNLKSTNSENFELKVVEGKVGVNLNANPSESLIAVAGDVVMANNEKLIKDRISNIITTKNRMIRLQFQDENLESIINVINKHYNSNLKLAGEELRNRNISVTFENDLSSIVNILSVSLNLELIRQPDSTIILKEKHE